MATAAEVTLSVPTTRTGTGGIATITGTDTNLTSVLVPTGFGAVNIQCTVADGKVLTQGASQGDAQGTLPLFSIVAGSEPFSIDATDCAPAVSGYWQFFVAGNTTVWKIQGAKRRPVQG